MAVGGASSGYPTQSEDGAVLDCKRPRPRVRENTQRFGNEKRTCEDAEAMLDESERRRCRNSN